ncbi:MAG: hypothetical protein CVU59_00100 [Deltaproteobacteria bacterium HGW-Deltaproteobacteria-17]|nr:MAG: hypothetical protein CVU59_00100 [Deltaproteobacteria bacterium HGW-Deltaproteobacteria-17]
MMKEIKTLIANLFNTPSDNHMLEELENLVLSSDEPAQELAAVLVKAAQRALLAKQLELAHRFYRFAERRQPDDLELISAIARMLDEELWLGVEALGMYRRVAELDPKNDEAVSRLEALEQEAGNWEKMLEKYTAEADSASEPQWATHMYFRAAEVAAKYGSDLHRVEELLKKALEMDPGHSDTIKHIEYLYRAQKRYAELADFLREKLPRVTDTQERAACLLEVAYLELEHTHQPQLAEEHLKEVAQLIPGMEKTSMLLVEAFTQQEKWEDLIALYESELKNGSNAEEMSLQLGMLWWKKVGDLDTAEQYFSKLRKGDNMSPLVMNFYSEYYVAKDDYMRHLTMLQQAMRAVANDVDKSVELARRISEISVDKSPEKAIDVWKRILKMDKMNTAAIDALKDLYFRGEKWNALMELYKDVEHALPTDDIAGRISVLMDMAELIEEKMKVDAMVVNVYNAILKLDPHHPRAMDALAEKYESMGRWRDVIVIYEEKNASETDPAKKKNYLKQIANLWGTKLSNPNKAAEPLEQILEVDPADLETITALKDIYEKRRNWKGLFELQLKEINLMPEHEQREKFIDLARFAQQPLGNAVLSIEMWNRVLEFDPHDIDALESLISLYEREKRFPALVEMLRRKIAMSVGDEALALLEKTGAILTDKMGATGEIAMSTWKTVLEYRPGHPKAMKILKELYSTNRDWEALEGLFADRENWVGYIETLHDCAEAATAPDEKIQLFFKIANVFTDRLQKPERAIKSYESILEVEPGNARAAALLLPIYEEAGRWKEVARMVEILLASCTEPSQRLAHLQKLVMVCEEKLNQAEPAFNWCAQAYVIDPQDDAIITRLEKLAEASRNWEALAKIYSEVLDRLSGGEKIRLMSRLANLYVHQLVALEQGEGIWRAVLAQEPESGEALMGLASIYELRQNWTELLEILNRQISSAPQLNDRLAAMMKMAQLLEVHLDKTGEAIEMYKKIISLASDYLPALAALDRLYEAGRMYENLAYILRQQENLSEGEQRIAFRLRLGRLYLGPLSDAQEALACFETILGEVPDHAGALSSLETMLEPSRDPAVRRSAAQLLAPCYLRMENWEAYARSLEVIATMEQDEDLKIQHYLELLNITVRRVGDTTRGLDIARVLFSLSPGNADVRQELRRLAILEDQIPQLKDLYIETLSVKPELKLTLAWEVALLEEEELHDQAESEKYYRMVLEEEPLHDQAFAALERITTSAERWKDLRLLIENRVEVLSDPDQQKTMLLKLSALNENILGDVDAAIASYRQLRQLEAGSQEAFVALQRLYDLAEDWAQLADLYQDELAYTRNNEQRILLMIQRADLLMHKLDRAPDAVSLLQEILSLNSSHISARSMLNESLEKPQTRQSAADILLNLFEHETNFEKIVELLEVKLEAAESRDEAVGILSRQGKLFTVQLGRPEQAFSAWRRALKLEPGNLEVRHALEELVDLSGNTAELIEVWNEAITAAGDDLELSMLYIEKIAQLYERQLSDPEKAVFWYKKLLSVSGDYVEIQSKATQSLILLLSTMDEWIDVIDLYRRQLGWLDNPRERKGVYRKVASLQEDMLDALEDAANTYHQLLGEFPEDDDALDRLEYIYSRLEKWEKLVEVLSRRAELSLDPGTRRDFYSRIAILREESLQNIEGAAEAWAAILSEFPEDGESLRYLARLNEALGRWADVFDLVERELALTTNEQNRHALLYRLGYILQVHLEEPARAIAFYRDVIEQDPEHEKAKLALETMLLGDEMLALEAASILEKIYELEDNWEKLTGLYVLKAGYSMDSQEKVDLFVKIAQIKEGELHEPGAAFGFYGQALKECLALPMLGDVLDNLQRLAAMENKWAELVAMYKENVDEILDTDLQEKVFLIIADVSRDELKNLDLARIYYQKVLEQRPDSMHALDALEYVYKEMADWEALMGIYLKRAELGYNDPDARYSALVLAATLCKEQLKKPKDAIVHYKEIIEFRPGDSVIFRALEELYFDQEGWEDLIELYEHRIRYVSELKEAVEIRYNMGEIYQDYLDEPERALEMFKGALGGDPTREDTIRRLEKFLDVEAHAASAAETLVPIYASRQNWKELIRVFSLQRQMLETVEERAPITKKIAGLYDAVLEDMDSAFVWYGYLFVETPSDRAVRSRLLSLADSLGRWQEVSEVFAKVLEEAYADLDYVLEVAEHLARIYSNRLHKVEEARKCYKRILDADHNRKDIFAELELMLLTAERWDDLLTIYREAAEAYYDPEKKNQYLFKMSSVFEDKLEKYEDAVDTYKEILVGAPDDNVANTALRRLYTRLERWEDLVEHLLVLVQQQQHEPRELCELNLTLAKLYHEKLADPISAVDRIEAILQIEPLHEQAILFLESLLLTEDISLRAAALLQPIYQNLDQWEDLVNVYEIQIEGIDDQYQKIEYLKECADLYDTRGNRLDRAFASLSQAWLLDSTDRDLFEALYQLAVRQSNWAQCIEVYEKGIKDAYDTDLQVTVLLRIARIQAEILTQPAEARKSYLRVLEVQEDHLEALTELSILLEEMEAWEELNTILDRRSYLLHEPAESVRTLRQLALLQQKLELPASAVETWKRLLEVEPNESGALRALEALYEQSENWTELAEVLRQLAEVAETPDFAVALKLARIQEEKLEDNYEAISTLQRILSASHDHLLALQSCSRLYEKEQNWMELIQTLNQMVVLEPQDGKRNELIFRIAHVLQHEVSDVEQAIKKYQSILEFDSRHEKTIGALEELLEGEDFRPQAATILEPLYLEQSQSGKLIHLNELLLEVAVEPAVKEKLLRTIAMIYEQGNDLDHAFEYWGRLFRENPADTEVEGQLMRITAASGKWQRLVDLLDEAGNDVYEPTLRKRLILTVTQLYEVSLENTEAAIDTLKKGLDAVPSDLEILAQLDRLLTATQKHEDLQEVLRAQADATDGATKAQFLYRLGHLNLHQFNKGEDAIEVWQEALNFQDDHPEIFRELEALLGSGGPLVALALEVLEPAYERMGANDKLVMVLEVRVTLTEDAGDRAGLLERAAQLCKVMGYLDKAITLLAQGVALAPDNVMLLESFIELAQNADRIPTVLTTVLDILGREIDEMAAIAMALRVAPLALSVGDVVSGEKLYLAVLSREGENMDAIRALENLYRVGDDTQKLVAILQKRAEQEYDPNTKKSICSEVANLAETQLNDLALAESAWKNLLESDESDLVAQDQLIRLFERMEKWNELIEVMKTKINYMPAPHDQQRLRQRIAQTYDEKLNQKELAEEQWREAYDSDPSFEPAYLALMAIYKEKADWDAVKDLFFTRLGQASVDSERLSVLEDLANLSMNQLKEIDDAVGYWMQILEVDPQYGEIFEKLSKVLIEGERYYELADVLQKRADFFAARGDRRLELQALDQLARLWEEKLESPTEARRILERILENDPASVTALTGLARLFENMQDWEHCQQYLEKAALLEPQGQDGAELAFRRGKVAEKLGDGEKALSCWEEAIRLYPAHQETFEVLSERARAAGDKEAILRLMQKRLPLITEKTPRLALLRQLADLYIELGASEAAFPALEEALTLDPTNMEIKQRLGDAYFAAANYPKAAEVYQKLLDELAAAKAPRKDLAPLYQRLGGIKESQGDLDAALELYIQSQKADTTYVPNLISMAGLYARQENYDQAQRMFRALLFQRIEGEITKAQIFLEIAKIEIKTGNAAKAKSSIQRGLAEDPNHAELKALLETV